MTRKLTLFLAAAGLFGEQSDRTNGELRAFDARLS